MASTKSENTVNIHTKIDKDDIKAVNRLADALEYFKNKTGKDPLDGNSAKAINNRIKEYAESSKDVKTTLTNYGKGISNINESTKGFRAKSLINIGDAIGTIISQLDKITDATAVKTKFSTLSTGIKGIGDSAKDLDTKAINTVSKSLSGLSEAVSKFDAQKFEEYYAAQTKLLDQQISKSLEKQKLKTELAQKMNEESRQKALSGKTAWLDALLKGDIKGALFGKKTENITWKYPVGDEYYKFLLDSRAKTAERLKNTPLRQRGKRDFLRSRIAEFDSAIDYTKSNKAASIDTSKTEGLLSGMKGLLATGLKGMLSGILLNGILKVATTVIKVVTKPMKLALGFFKKIGSFLTNTLKQAETFKNLMELAVLPFTLIFTLLFAPVLMQLAPILVGIINVVMEHKDKIFELGDRLADLILTFVDNSDIIKTFASVLESVFNWTGKLFDALGGVLDGGFLNIEEFGLTIALLFKEVLDWVVDWAYSGEGQMTLMNIVGMFGIIIGELLEKGIQLIPILIEALLVGLGGIVVGLFGSVVSDWVDRFKAAWQFISDLWAVIGKWWSNIWDSISMWWNGIGSWFGGVFAGIKEFFAGIVRAIADWLSSFNGSIIGFATQPISDWLYSIVGRESEKPQSTVSTNTTYNYNMSYQSSPIASDFGMGANGFNMSTYRL